MGLLDHVVALFLVFKGTSIPFSIVVVLIYILTKSIGGFPFLKCGLLLINYLGRGLALLL